MRRIELEAMMEDLGKGKRFRSTKEKLSLNGQDYIVLRGLGTLLMFYEYRDSSLALAYDEVSIVELE
jgi:hypothetical protein